MHSNTMTSEILVKIPNKFLVCLKAEWPELLCFICTFDFTEKQCYTEKKNLTKFFSDTGYPGTVDNTIKTFFLGHLFYMYIYVWSWLYFCWSMWTTSLCLCLSRHAEGPPHFLEDFLSSSWLPFQKNKEK